MAGAANKERVGLRVCYLLWVPRRVSLVLTSFMFQLTLDVYRSIEYTKRRIDHVVANLPRTDKNRIPALREPTQHFGSDDQLAKYKLLGQIPPASQQDLSSEKKHPIFTSDASIKNNFIESMIHQDLKSSSDPNTAASKAELAAHHLQELQPNAASPKVFPRCTRTISCWD
ncbi:hypothetical protein K470DRAFT_287214 [Piedraia hortae CBS 480.64]|uniref:Uncharacterized protein n=1 Tax=Piedraia hortae CBS 480.64 TaxID=1314780 RepID=A0A6A7C9R1_9PEZI|nr:hypothetical protein K470DRAFT_287214 [Piedraia hortae CBS 480.64]